MLCNDIDTNYIYDVRILTNAYFQKQQKMPPKKTSSQVELKMKEL